MKEYVTITTKSVFKKQSIIDLLVCALEGGSNYWYYDLERSANTSNLSNASDKFYDDLVTNGFSISDHLDDDRIHLITPEKIELGLQIMANKYHDHFQDFKKDQADAETGDV